MTVRRVSGMIFLEGDCGVEEAEILLQALVENSDAEIDWTACGRLHTAVLQLILASNIPVRGPCGNTWLRQWISSMVQQ
jgi:hypothetical protein